VNPLPITHHPSPKKPQGFFVTGTDTGVGKTLISCALLQAFVARGERAVGMKPVAAGCTPDGRNEDVDALRAAGNVAASEALVNPYRFPPPTAPHLAAAETGTEIELDVIATAYRGLAALADVVIVEGVGGFCVPLNAREDTADLAVKLALPVLFVVGLRLGCLNHALLTAEAIRARGLRLAGWVANALAPDMDRQDPYISALQARLSMPMVACMPFVKVPDARTLAPQFDLTYLA
jgi:dethiobiotin synthetase